jgi:hypothetical protein
MPKVLEITLQPSVHGHFIYSIQVKKYDEYIQILTKVSPKSRLYETIFYFFKIHICVKFTHTKKNCLLTKEIFAWKVGRNWTWHSNNILFYNS